MDVRRDPGARGAHDAKTILDRSEREVCLMLIRRNAAAEPRIVGDVDENLHTPAAILPRELREDRLVTDENSRFAEGVAKRSLVFTAAETAEVFQPLEPVGVEKWHALDDRDEKFLAVRRLPSNGAGGVGRHCRVEHLVILRASRCGGRQEFHVQYAEEDRNA